MTAKQLRAKDLELDQLFAALSDQTRRGIVLTLSKQDSSISALSADYKISLTGLRKHLKVLEDAGMVRVSKIGRTHYCSLKPMKFQLIINQIKLYESFWNQKLDLFAKQLEALEMRDE